MYRQRTTVTDGLVMEPQTVDRLMEAVTSAARIAARPAGPTPWYVDPVSDGVAIRMTVRRWTEAPSAEAVLARVGCGTALRAASLAVVGLGRRPVTTVSSEPGVLAVLRAGEYREPCREEVAMLDGLQRFGVPRRLDPAVREAGLLPWLRRAAEREGVWARNAGRIDATGLGPAWSDGRAVPEHPSTLAMGADGPPPYADVRLGRAIEAVRLTAAALGWWTRIAAAPVDRSCLHDALGGSAGAVLGTAHRGTTLALLQVSPALAFVIG
ncbi:hypothetical protein [Pseudonocardia sp. N23]|uniref:hypothetical protein n=1 Tax=Pseudonocardia sp. N23 TaxID=1987376 RepID=UPI000BFC7538|nr:hypothetical protein [Pseudonocardia sp. N23]GAY07373.1 hypothetical protein TOK_2598 [Pseudonocardia sp. N23]